MNIGLLTYDFPHKKTIDFISALYMSGYQVKCVIGAPPVKLNLPEPTIRIKPRHLCFLNTVDICRSLSIPYFIAPHRSKEAIDILKKFNIDLLIIGGARILKGDIITVPEKGVLNLHPGIIPDVRGLDALKWAIYYNKPIGVTAHIIDENIDGGIIVKREELKLYKDDTFIDISLRLEELEVKLMLESVKLLESSDLSFFEKVNSSESPINSSMSPEKESTLDYLLKKRLSNIEEG